MSNALDSLRYHLLITYANDLRTFRTIAERAQIVSMTLKNFEAFLTDVSVLKESAQLVVADVDKAQWMLKGIISAMELHHSPERRI
jgi:hypothetical protein